MSIAPTPAGNRQMPDNRPARAVERPFYITGGTLPPDASSYVPRHADQDLYDGLLTGEYCYILNTRQMGKSSLMVRTAQRLRDAGCIVAVLDLTAIGQNLTVEQWYDGLLVSLAEQSGMEDELEGFWEDNPQLGPMQRFLPAIRQVLLPRLNGRNLIIFVDEIDAVRSLPLFANARLNRMDKARELFTQARQLRSKLMNVWRYRLETNVIDREGELILGKTSVARQGSFTAPPSPKRLRSL
jgi:hypothetical protein